MISMLSYLLKNQSKWIFNSNYFFKFMLIRQNKFLLNLIMHLFFRKTVSAKPGVVIPEVNIDPTFDQEDDNHWVSNSNNPTNIPPVFHVGTSFQRGMHVVCSQGSIKSFIWLFYSSRKSNKLRSILWSNTETLWSNTES